MMTYKDPQQRKSSPSSIPSLVDWRKEKQNETDKIILGMASRHLIVCVYYICSICFLCFSFSRLGFGGLVRMLLCTTPLFSRVLVSGFVSCFNIVSQSISTASCFFCASTNFFLVRSWPHALCIAHPCVRVCLCM